MVTKIPRLGPNFQASCIILPECWGYRWYHHLQLGVVLLPSIQEETLGSLPRIWKGKSVLFNCGSNQDRFLVLVFTIIK